MVSGVKGHGDVATTGSSLSIRWLVTTDGFNLAMTSDFAFSTGRTAKIPHLASEFITY